MAHSSSGLGRRPLTAETRVRVPVALQIKKLRFNNRNFFILSMTCLLYYFVGIVDGVMQAPAFLALHRHFYHQVGGIDYIAQFAYFTGYD